MTDTSRARGFDEAVQVARQHADRARTAAEGADLSTPKMIKDGNEGASKALSALVAELEAMQSNSETTKK